MNHVTRSLRAIISVSAVVVVALVNFDAAGHSRVGAEYRYDMALVITIAGTALAVILFTWNAVQYARSRR